MGAFAFAIFQPNVMSCIVCMFLFLLDIYPIFRLFNRTLARRSHLFFQIELDGFDGALPVMKYTLASSN